MTELWISTAKFTGEVRAKATGEYMLIARTPPVWGRFIGQPLEHLLVWLHQFGTVQVETIT